jgi:hypothetical protein
MPTEPISQIYYSRLLKLHFWDWGDNGKSNLISGPKAGHWVHHDQLEIFVEETRKFFERSWKRIWMSWTPGHPASVRPASQRMSSSRHGRRSGAFPELDQDLPRNRLERRQDAYALWSHGFENRLPFYLELLCKVLHRQDIRQIALV